MVMWRAAFVLGFAVCGAAVSDEARADEMSAEQARKFVIGKTFTYQCFDGTRGTGRIHGDGSLAGTIQMRGNGPLRYAALPANTLQVRGARVCATVKGAPFEPCFALQKTSETSFRGSVSGLGFAYCDFSRGKRGRFTRTAHRDRGKPLSLRSSLQ
jgi:hypothetical protein